MEITHLLVTHFHPDHLGGRMMGMSVRGATELLEEREDGAPDPLDRSKRQERGHGPAPN